MDVYVARAACGCELLQLFLDIPRACGIKGEYRASLVRRGRMARTWSSSVVVWLSSSEVVVVATTATDNYIDGNPLLPSATKAGPCVPSLAGTAPGCVLGRGRPGWAGAGRGRRRGVVADDGLHRRRRRLRGVGVGRGGGYLLKELTTFERQKLFECGFQLCTA